MGMRLLLGLGSSRGRESVVKCRVFVHMGPYSDEKSERSMSIKV